MSGYSDTLGWGAGYADGTDIPCSSNIGFGTFTTHRRAKCVIYNRWS